MPSPRPSGSGTWKILVLPHSLQYQVLHLVTFSSHSSEPRVGSFKGGFPCGLVFRGPDLCLALLWTIAANVFHLTAIVTLHLGQPPLSHLLLMPVISLVRLEGRFGRVIEAQSFVFLVASAFHFSSVAVIVQNIFCVG